VQSGPGSELGTLLVTTDGGRTWTWLKKSLGVMASIRFVSAKVGWAAGGPADSDLLVTRDGGKTWQKVAPLPPRDVGTVVTIETASLKRVPPGGRAALPMYGLPTLHDSLHAYLPVTYEVWQPGKAPGRDKLVVYETSDAGRSWVPVRAVATDHEGGGTYIFPQAVTDSTLIVPQAAKSRAPRIASIPLAHARGHADVTASPKGASQLSFVSPQRG
jgi:hypothetical protein